MATPALLQQSPTSAPSPPRPPKPQRYWLHFFLLIVTGFSTTAVGMRYMFNFHRGMFPLATDADIFPYDWVYSNMRHFADGLPFSLTLLGILLVHEFGHYFAARTYGVRATLPYLLPAPSLSGTAGAVIRLRSRVKTRSALLAIGAFGPISGFVVAIIMACVGFALSKPVLVEPIKLVDFTPPLIIRLIEHVIKPGGLPYSGGPLLWHPVFVASWIGILITSLNLIPAGQLDGGHILYAVSPRLHRIVTWITMGALVVLSITSWLGWLLWTALLLLPGMRHPKVADPEEPKLPLLIVAPICFLLLALCVSAQPFSHESLYEILKKVPWHDVTAAIHQKLH
jgi:membrane-associated protease RseP (regulator of RpoE activity)